MLTPVPDDYCPEVFRGMVKRGRGGRQRPYGAWPQNHPAHTSRLVSSRYYYRLIIVQPPFTYLSIVSHSYLVRSDSDVTDCIWIMGTHWT